MAADISNPADLRGVAVTGRAGERLGKVEEIYLDNETGKPEWVTVKTGFLGSGAALVPMAAADWDGSELTVPYDRDMVKGAPHGDPGRELSRSDEAELFSYYGIPYGGDTVTATDGAGQAVATDSPSVDSDLRIDTSQAVDSGRTDASGAPTDDAMIRSEERLVVGTEVREAGKARLRKYITTETVTRTVPVSHDELTVEREVITDADRGAAPAGGDLTEEVREVTLHEERPIVVKETVPVERVRLGTTTVTEQATVTDEVRKENIVVEGPGTDSESRADER